MAYSVPQCVENHFLDVVLYLEDEDEYDGSALLTTDPHFISIGINSRGPRSVAQYFADRGSSGEISNFDHSLQSPSSINFVPAQARKITVGMASHWPCVTDNNGITTYGLTALEGR